MDGENLSLSKQAKLYKSHIGVFTIIIPLGKP